MRAADEAKRVLLEVAADEMEASPDDLETDGEGNVRVIGSPGSTMTVQDVALAAHFKHGKTISGRGMYMKPKSEVVPETGEMDPDSTEAHACTVADVEVDTETGFVRVLRLASAYEIGCAINPALVEARSGRRLDGDVARAVRDDGAVLPGDRLCAGDFSTYLMPGPLDLPEIEGVVLEMPSSNGLYGMKGVGEMTANPPIPAIANAVTDAIGVQICDLPITPEKVPGPWTSKEAA